MNAPHGAKTLVHRTLPESRRERLRRLPRLTIGPRAVSDLHNIATGVFTPLDGFMDRRTLESVLDRNRLSGSSTVWPVSVVLDVDARQAEGLRVGREALLVDESGREQGVIKVSELYAHEKRRHAKRLYGTLDRSHPGVRLIEESGDVLVAGKVRAFEGERSGRHLLTPLQTREIFAERGLATVAGFQTRNVAHRAHEYLQRCALEMAEGLFIQPIVGWVKAGDFKSSVITDIYPKFIRGFYPRRTVVFGTLDTAMRYAGPKDAAFHAIIRKNFGCTHFVVGRDHAGVGGFYGHYEAQEFLAGLGDFGIKILPFKEPIYCSGCGMIVTERVCGHSEKFLHPISGTLIRSCLTSGKTPPAYIFRPEIYAELRKLAKRGGLFAE